MTQSALTREPLSPHHAFVVQFRGNADLSLGQFHGRVEHVRSGRATTFSSFAELADFLVQVVTELRLPAEDEANCSCDSARQGRRQAAVLAKGVRPDRK